MAAKTKQMSKADENALLRKFKQQVFGHTSDMYLKSLFTEEFLNWVAGRISDDIAPDIMAWLQEARISRDKVATEAERMAQEAARDLNAVEQVRDSLREKVKTKQSELDVAREQFQLELEQALVFEKDWEGEYARAERLETEVTRLKAKLFDYMEREQVRHEKPDLPF
jgi:hypothetical protein